MDNSTMLQYFDWYLPDDGSLWKQVAERANDIRWDGYDLIWLPPAYKGADREEVGYGVYDLYDLGEFDQKDTVRTKYGTKDEYLHAIDRLHEAGCRVITDIVLNQRTGADETEEIEVDVVDPQNRNEVLRSGSITAWTKFTFPGRAGKYSDFTWDATDFSGVDYDEQTQWKGIFRMAGKEWNKETDDEHGSFDYLMGADVDTDNPEVAKELKDWGAWYYDTVHMDGVRMDAVKHISFTYVGEWIRALREHAGWEIPAVGEYWSAQLDKLEHYLEVNDNALSLFDVPLHFNFYNASNSGGYFSMRHLFSDSLVAVRPDNAVTFVDNHDTEPGQSLQSFVLPWFKPIAYAIILLRDKGLPCVFYGDLYGIPSQSVEPVKELPLEVKCRQMYAYGEQRDYLDSDDLVGWTREGDEEHPDSGLAVVCTDGPGGTVEMEIGEKFAGRTFRDILGNCLEEIVIDEEGKAIFRAEGGSVSIWVTLEAIARLNVELPDPPEPEPEEEPAAEPEDAAESAEQPQETPSPEQAQEPQSESETPPSASEEEPPAQE